MTKADIKVHSTNGFTPASYPGKGDLPVMRNDPITFVADGSSGDVTFYADDGLFWTDPDKTIPNIRNTPFTAPAPTQGQPDLVLTLVVAATKGPITYTLSLSPVSSAHEAVPESFTSDGMINVSTKPMPTKEWPGHAPQRHAPEPAMQAPGSD